MEGWARETQFQASTARHLSMVGDTEDGVPTAEPHTRWLVGAPSSASLIS
jgi:hypothetical protein